MAKRIIVLILLFFVFLDISFIYLILHTTPIDLKRTRFTYEYGETISTDPSYYFNGHEDLLMNIQMDLTNVSSGVGIYQVSATYYQDMFNFEIEVKDTQIPKFKLKQIEYEIERNQKIYAKDLVVEVEDLSETNIYFINLETNEKKDYLIFHELGSYIERIIVEDIYGNQSASLRLKIVVSKNKIPPVFIGIEDEVIQLHNRFDPLKGVKAKDNNDGDLTKSITTEGYVNTDVVGEYEIIYTVTDSDGNISSAIRKIKVIEQ